MVFDRAQLKMTAKQAMKFQRPHPMLITLLFLVLVQAGTWIINQIMSFATADNPLSQMMSMVMSEYADPEDVLEYFMYAYDPGKMFMSMFISVFVVNILVSLWSGLMRTGYSGFCLGMVRGQQPQANALFNTLPLWAGILLTQFLVALFSALWGMLFIVGTSVVVGILAAILNDFEGLMILLVLAAMVVAILGYVWVILRYAMVNFIIADQGLTGLDAIRESKRMMQGNISSLFTLELSFIGWYILEGVIAMVIYTIFAGSFAARIYGVSSYEGMMSAMSGGLQGLNTVSIVVTIATTLYNMWLTPYVTGTEALFYDTMRGAARPMGGYGAGPAGPGGQGGWGGPGAPGGWGGPSGGRGPGGYGGQGGYGGPGGQGGQGGYGAPGGQGGQGGWGQQPPQQNGGYNWTPTPGSSSGRGLGPGGQGGPRPPQPPQQPPRAPRDDAWK